MNAAKNWALTIMIIALAFAHFSSELLLKEQMIITVKKNVKQRWSYRRKIDRFWRNLPKKNLAKSAVFYWFFLREVPPPPEFPVKSADFSANFDFFPPKIPRNWPIFSRIFPWKSREILRFFPKISEALFILCTSC